jgi:hypothetical protein
MRLTLTYEGPLHAASAGNTRNSEKHEIRRVFHRQLRDLWFDLPLKDAIGRYSVLPKEERAEVLHDVGLFTFLPLISRRLHAIAELDILFLRHEPVGGIVNQAGDIDNRIKVLFDALRMPLNKDEIPATASPSSDEDVFCCLLENDSLITAFRLESERLLGPMEPQRESNVKLVIRVSVKLQRLTYENIGLGDMG